jgi:transposase
MEWSSEQLAELSAAGRRHPKPGVRVKALAVLAVARGHTREAVAEMFDRSALSVGAWVRSYRERGLGGLAIAQGRGRKPQAHEEEVRKYALESPRNHGINRSRWTLELLAQTVPSLRGFSPAGVRQVLHRLRLHYKRGQAWLTSPDPEYEKKTP